MTQEEKRKLLLKDLCARLPYKVKAQIIARIQDDSTMFDNTVVTIMWVAASKDHIEDIKPYLRPMSSMTEEEKDEFHRLKQMSVTVAMPNGVSRMNPEYIVDINDDGDDLTHLYDWLNEHYFDYRGLIEKGLAQVAPEDMYPTK